MSEENREFMTELECDHCGGTAIESVDGLFYDGDDGSCDTCGFPGMVSVYEDENGREGDDGECYTAVWQESDDDAAVCNDPACEECKDRRTDKDGAK